MKYDGGNRLSGQVIGSASTVHRAVGPGLDESVYETLMCAELAARGIAHERQLPLPLIYKGMRLDCGFRLDLWVEHRLIIEVKSVETVLPVHEAQLLTYLQLAPCELGLLINFDVPVIKQGVRNELPVICLSVTKLTPLHHARLLGQLRLGCWPVGLLINFNVTALSRGVRRVVNSAGKVPGDVGDIEKS